MYHRRFGMLLLACLLLCAAAWAEGIAVQPCPGGNLRLAEQPADGPVRVSITTPIPNWFCGQFTGLPTDRDTRIDLRFKPGAAAGILKKWTGLCPVMTCADPTRYDSYLWYRKDARGQWVSSDPFATARLAGSGAVPAQQAVPVSAAAACLSADGTEWCPWQEITGTQPMPEDAAFRLSARFPASTTTLAMRIPYPPAYAKAFVDKLRAAKRPGVTLYSLGQSDGKQELTAIAIGDPTPTDRDEDNPVVLLYGDEDGDEPDGAWVVQGAMQWLLSDDPQALAARKQTTFLCLPLLDQDGMQRGTYAHLTNTFLLKRIGDAVLPETLAYARFIIDWTQAGHRLDLACTLHNVECTEGPNVLCPVIDLRHAAAMTDGNAFLLARLTGVQTATQSWMTGFLDDRLVGFCQRNWGSLYMAYEINSRYPARHLSLPRLHDLGRELAGGLSDYLHSPLFAPLAPQIAAARREHVANRQAYLYTHGATDNPDSAYQTLTLGF